MADNNRKKNRTLAGVLAILTGTLGIHKFYLGQWKKGILYLLFFWTGIPMLLSLLEGAHLLGSEKQAA
ncbi:MAG: TM2 domain-containing protein [Eubacterium sp.]|nr:TM2 domain-containing protein [Eubacterium sp.]